MINIPRNIWLPPFNYFEPNDETDLPCPSCDVGRLVVQKQSKEETKLSYISADFEQKHTAEFVFSAILTCNQCREAVACSGIAKADNPIFDGEASFLYYPKYFQPALRIFSFPTYCPTDVRNALLAAFSLYWSDPDAAANQIRSTVEIILDTQKVQRIAIVLNRQSNRKERRTLSLHKRIEKFKTKNSEIADFIFAIKWIGNYGSHNSQLIYEDILDACELLKHSIDELYDKKISTLQYLSRAVNKNKGPLRRKPIK